MARPKAVLESVESPPGRGSSSNGPQGRGSRRDRRRASARTVRPTYERRYRQTVRRVDLWSVLKISVCFHLTALIVVLFAGVVLWWIASAAGIIGNVETFVADLIGNESDDFEFLSWEVLRASTLVGLVFVSIMVVMTTLAAAFYNLFAELIGGVEVTVVEDEYSSGR